MKYEKNLSDIKKDIEEIFEIEDLSLRYRGSDLVMLRYLYMTLARKFTDKSLKIIGTKVNLKYSDVIHGLKKFDVLLQYYPDIKYILYELDKKYTDEHYSNLKFDTVEVVYCDLVRNVILTERQINKTVKYDN